MAKFDKDLHQKEMAIRFCLVNGLIPFLEVNVQNFRELSDTSTVITDIDALGVRVDSSGRPRKVIFDCKTLKNTSPINRAFWAAGLMNFTGCNEAFIILRKRASEAHRLSAKQIGVHLFDEPQFASYSESCSIDFRLDYCYSTDINNWVKLEGSCRGNQPLEQFLSFLSNDVPIEKDSVKSFRKILAAIRKVRGEFDPAKPKHRAVYYYTLSVFCYVLSQIVYELRNIVDFDANEATFEKALKYYIWSGKDSFELRNKLQNLQGNPNVVDSELKLKNWEGFLELCRNLMDSPSDIPKCISPLREFAFMQLADQKDEKNQYIKREVESSNRIRQFSSFMSSYLLLATDLPKDLNDHLDSTFDQALQ
ncbi:MULTISPECIES: hypothetical protein [Vibrio]|uniref:hypothetical protein n=1 Tax=Vibrio TaxID=662 RepID=UPI000D3513E4|nr:MULTISPECIES: hypothetical protein [Vibrio]PTP82935.1 hypothetical protein CWO03_20230 [Vibrio splendidus]